MGLRLERDASHPRARRVHGGVNATMQHLVPLLLLLLQLPPAAAAPVRTAARGPPGPAPPPPFVGPCVFAENSDCNGQDMKKVHGPAENMTQEACCSLCKTTPGCKVAVLATGWQKDTNLCELKSGCAEPKGMTHRVKCCLPGAPGAEGCSTKPPPPPPPCNAALLPVFCDALKPIDERVSELLGKMTPAEKIAQVGSNGVPGIDRLGIPAYQWWGEAQHGVCQSPSVQFRPPTPFGTSFPEPGLTGATFDKELFSEVGVIIGKEGRAMANAGNAGLTFWAPNINIVRNARRHFELHAEDNERPNTVRPPCTGASQETEDRAGCVFTGGFSTARGWRQPVLP